MKKLLFIVAFATQITGFSQNPLFIPDTLSGELIDLNLDYGQVAYYDGYLTNTIGYNQDLLGPTLILNRGEEVTINVANHLSEPTTLHWHGLHVSAKNDGGPHTVINTGAVWSPSFTVLDQAATYWYHPHLHEHTEKQVTYGGAGFIIVRDEEEAQLSLPRTYGVDDFPIVIQSRAFDNDKQFLVETALDDIILTNGTIDPYLEVPAQVVRLRLLNGSTERVYNLGFQANLNFYQIATDGGLLDAPVVLNRLRLVPGERAEVLVDLSALEGQLVDLMSFASELPNGIYGAANPSGMPIGSIAGYNSNILNGNDFKILQLNVGAMTTNSVTEIPTSLITNSPYAELSADQTRNLLFQPAQMGPTGMLNGPFEINNTSFDSEVINYEIPLDHTEVWELTNMTAIAHPFHIHDVQFYILDINGASPLPNMQGRKDVVLVPPMGGTVRFITKFEDFADEETPYMYHCHMLNHEDEGMMGQFLVIDNATSTKEFNNSTISIYPNPTKNRVEIKGLPSSIIGLFNASGQLLEERENVNEATVFNLDEFVSGVYYFKIVTAYKNQVYKVVKE